jgi:hypothetical protein
MRFVTPSVEELAALRPDPLIFEQELDLRPQVAASLERALGFRGGRRYWRSESGYLYAVDLGDFGRGQPSMALIHGFWPRYEPRPLNDEQIDDDLEAFLFWMSEVCDGLDPEDLRWTLERSPRHRARASRG